MICLSLFNILLTDGMVSLQFFEQREDDDPEINFTDEDDRENFQEIRLLGDKIEDCIDLDEEGN